MIESATARWDPWDAIEPAMVSSGFPSQQVCFPSMADVRRPAEVGVVEGEPGVGHAAEGAEDLLCGRALVGHNAAMVDLGQSGDVPSVSGVERPALTCVAGETFEGRGPEEVHLGPGAALNPVDGADPGVGRIGAGIRAAALDERSREPDIDPVSVEGM